jgi:acyl carrier protein
MQSEIRLQVRNFVVENFLFGDGNSLKDTDLFLEEGIIDSTGVLELVAFLEETYGFKVEDEELIPENLNSVAFVADYATKKLQALNAGQK